MYKEIENVTLEINAAEELNDTFLDNIYFIINFTKTNKIILYTDYKYNFIDNFIKRYKNLEIYINHKYNEKYSFYYEKIKIKNLILDKNYYYFGKHFLIVQIDISKKYNLNTFHNLERISDTIIIEFTYSKRIDLINYSKILNQLSKLNMELNFSGLVKEINLITEHPCNMYLCSDNNCHSNKSHMPRYLYIDKYGIRPYKALNKQIIFCKEINSTLIDKKNFYNDYIKSK